MFVSRVRSYCSFIVTSVFVMILVKLSSIFKVSYLIGSQVAFFSASSFVQPLMGYFSGIGGSILFLGVGLGARSLFGSLSLRILAYHIPGFCASAYFASSSWVLAVALPLVCMVLFIAHPVGFFAAPYALYWLIPILLHKTQSHGLFSKALTATFIAHAVGSVVWIYTTPMTAPVWLAMIPLVALERCVFACGMVGVISLAAALQKAYERCVVLAYRKYSQLW
jgi:hypothetical protein